MTRYALIRNGQIVEERFYESPPVVKNIGGKPVLRPIRAVPATYDKDFQTHSVQIEIKDNEVVETWVVEDLPRDQINDRLIAALAEHRYGVEVGGVSIGNQSIQTDRESRANLTAARIVALEALQYAALKQTNPSAAAATDALIKASYEKILASGVTWKTASGFVSLPAAQTISAANIAFGYVQKCFEAESFVTSNINQYNSRAEVIAAFNTKMAE